MQLFAMSRCQVRGTWEIAGRACQVYPLVNVYIIKRFWQSAYFSWVNHGKSTINGFKSPRFSLSSGVRWDVRWVIFAIQHLGCTALMADGVGGWDGSRDATSQEVTELTDYLPPYASMNHYMNVNLMSILLAERKVFSKKKETSPGGLRPNVLGLDLIGHIIINGPISMNPSSMMCISTCIFFAHVRITLQSSTNGLLLVIHHLVQLCFPLKPLSEGRRFPQLSMFDQWS